MARRGDALYQRGRTWWLDFQHEGRRHIIRLGRGISKTAAGELASVKRAAILKGEAGIGRRRRDLTFDQAKEEFLKWAKANKRWRTLRAYRQCLEVLARAFAGRRLSQISTFDLERYKRDRLEAGVRVRVNRELAVLKTLYNRCRDWAKYEGENPVTRIRFVRESEGRVRYLEPDEERKLIEVAREPLRTIILAGIYAGLRIEAEALTLRWESVDLKRGLLTVQSAYAKSGKTRTVPLNHVLRAALSRLRERAEGGYVFCRGDGSLYKSIRTAFETACRRAGVKGVTPHVLRHTFASRLVMAGVDLRTVQELGGWADLTMVQRYAHLSPGHKAEAVERISWDNSTTLFTTPTQDRLVSMRAPVAQVDRAAVS